MFACIHHISLQLYVAQVRTVLRVVHFPMNRLTKDKDWLDAHLLVHFLCNTLSHASMHPLSLIRRSEESGPKISFPRAQFIACCSIRTVHCIVQRVHTWDLGQQQRLSVIMSSAVDNIKTATSYYLRII